ENDDAEVPRPPDMFRRVKDDEVQFLRPKGRADVDAFSPIVPDSLREAIEYFLLATAARWARGHRMKHSSMLVHTTMSLPAHRALKDRIDAEIKQLRRSLDKSATRARLEKLWLDEHPKVRRDELDPVPFATVEAHLGKVLERLRVVVDNSQSNDRLLYKEEAEITDADEVVHIAVGGNTLSRGLTLEGLMVSYFVRSASAYDTLLQMGRWFGYRFGYEDLSRIWMTDELRQAFHDLPTVQQDLRHDIARYQDDNVTPLQFAVRIRRHPTLAVTSRLKMQHAMTVQIDYARSTRQTTIFHHRNREWLRNNWDAGASLVEALTPRFTKDGAHWVATGVPVERVLTFLNRYECHDGHTELRREFLRKYIEKQNSRSEYKSWTVAVISLKDASSAKARLGSLEVAPVNRSKLQDRGEGVDLGTITTQENFRLGLSPEQQLQQLPKNDSKHKQPKRPADSEPLLILVPIDKDSKPQKPARGSESVSQEKLRSRPRDPLDASEHILGLALAFPDSKVKSMGEDYIQVQLPAPPIDDVELEEITVEDDDG
ncbi:MAG TPA: Z1 domain-containing protein, partial [Polyangium sp.]|nr:Z1 domain-containing protein [Polyangium sp.]